MLGEDAVPGRADDARLDDVPRSAALEEPESLLLIVSDSCTVEFCDDPLF